MIPRSVSVVVFAAAQRATHELCFQSIRESDVGEHLVCHHPPELTANEHWYATHEFAANAPTELVVVLEDDCLVNRHLAWNVGTWRWPHDGDFGAGWIYNPGGSAKKDVWYRGPREWHGTVGVVYRTEMLPKLIERAWPRIRGGEAWDIAVASAAHTGDDGRSKRIRIHYPALVEHLDEFPSVVGSAPSGKRTSRGTFDREWRRPIGGHEHGLCDQHGRSLV
jgi:hypothetical protein